MLFRESYFEIEKLGLSNFFCVVQYSRDYYYIGTNFNVIY